MEDLEEKPWDVEQEEKEAEYEEDVSLPQSSALGLEEKRFDLDQLDDLGVDTTRPIAERVPKVMWTHICLFLQATEVGNLCTVSSALTESCGDNLLWRILLVRHTKVDLKTAFTRKVSNWKDLFNNVVGKWLAKKRAVPFKIKVYVRFRPQIARPKPLANPKSPGIKGLSPPGTATTRHPRRSTGSLSGSGSAPNLSAPLPRGRSSSSSTSNPASKSSPLSSPIRSPQPSRTPSGALKSVGKMEVKVAYGDKRIRVFRYQGVLDGGVSQQTVYDNVAYMITDSVLRGYNGTLLVYGQTGSGKTFTMFGSGDAHATNLTTDNSSDSKVDMGIVPRTCQHLFDILALDPVTTTIFNVMYKEIYQNKASSLLANGAGIVAVKSLADIYRILEEGQKLKKVFATAMNDRSSRSHCVFTISLTQSNRTLGSVLQSVYHLVDLAGSERQSKTQAVGQRLEEAKAINKSLSALERVILALSERSKMEQRQKDNKTKSKPGSDKPMHIPYRDSELTTLLEESLGGNSQTTLLVTCSPNPDDVQETISTLRFGERTSTIQNRIEQIDKVQELRSKLSESRKQLSELEEWFDDDGLLTLQHISDLEDDLRIAMIQDKQEREERKQANIKPKLREEMPLTAKLQMAIQQSYAPFTAEQRKLFAKIRLLRRNIERLNGELKRLLRTVS